MTRSLGLAAYRAFARRKNAPQDAADVARPKGELVWIHSAEPGNMLAVRDLANRLHGARTNLNVLLTHPEDVQAPAPAALTPPGLIEQDAPSDHPAAVAAFLDHWAPDAAIWVWGDLKPNLIMAAADRKCPLFLIDADVKGFDMRRARWLPDVSRQVLTRFQAVFARSADGYRRLAQLGLEDDVLTQTSSLLAGGQALGCSESDLADLSAAMGGRPAWFANHVMPAEVPIILAAHRHASRLSHRLLLILQTAQPESAGAATDEANEQEFNVVQWDDGQFPDETAQVMISGDPVERGLFYRVAPVSFMGTTLVQGDGGCDPLEAAALGSAVLYGPKVRHFMPSYSRLAAAGAARIINDADALGAAVSNMIIPDHAATMAHAGWDVISQGAALTDRVVDMVQDALDAELTRA